MTKQVTETGKITFTEASIGSYSTTLAFRKPIVTGFVESSSGAINIYFTNITPSGFTVKSSAPFTGFVHFKITETQ